MELQYAKREQYACDSMLLKESWHAKVQQETRI